MRAELGRGELELETLREEAHRRRSRLASLTEIQDRYESFQKGVRAIMQEHREGRGSDGIKGLVADIVRPPAELETAVEAVLGERLGNIIVESHEAGVEAIQFLKQKREGRSSFIPRSPRTPQMMRVPMAARGEVVYDAGGAVDAAADPMAAFTPVVDSDAIAAAWPQGDGVRGPMLELIGYDRQYDEVAAYLLGDVLVVEDLERALALWRQTRTDKTIVTLDGEVIDPHGVVTGGSRESAVAGVLEQKREIRELEEVVARLDADIEARAGAPGRAQAVGGGHHARARRSGGGAAQRRHGAVRPAQGRGARGRASCARTRARRQQLADAGRGPGAVGRRQRAPAARGRRGRWRATRARRRRRTSGQGSCASGRPCWRTRSTSPSAS